MIRKLALVATLTIVLVGLLGTTPALGPECGKQSEFHLR